MSGHELLSSRIAFTAAPAAVRRARHWIAAQLARTDPAELIDAAVLLVSELVTNAVHASAAAAGSTAAPIRAGSSSRSRGPATRCASRSPTVPTVRFRRPRTHLLTMRAGAACRSLPR